MSRGLVNRPWSASGSASLFPWIPTLEGTSIHFASRCEAPSSGAVELLPKIYIAQWSTQPTQLLRAHFRAFLVAPKKTREGSVKPLILKIVD